MQVYRVTLIRSYMLTVMAESPGTARQVAEFYLGHSDVSTPTERETLGFSIEDIQLAQNDSIEVEALSSAH